MNRNSTLDRMPNTMRPGLEKANSQRFTYHSDIHPWKNEFNNTCHKELKLTYTHSEFPIAEQY